jgi:hypothetical protein
LSKNNPVTQKLYRENNREKLNADAKAWNKRNPEKVIQAHAKYYQKNKDRLKKEQYDRRRLSPIVYLLNAARARAKKQGIEFDITEEDFSVLPTLCPVLGIELVYIDETERWNASASLDRTDNTKGYIKGNVSIISSRANNLKNDGTVEEFKKIILYIESHKEGLHG